jgi:anaerobic magnesium-protoporphyrin IX monomethyl ester cyclase
MKTIIINPPTEKGFERSGRWPSKSTGGACQEPIFLAYAAAVLEKNNLEVELIDCRPNYINLKSLSEKITENTGLIVMQTSTPSINLDLETAKYLKEKNKNIKIAFVGTHPTALDQEILRKNPFLDLVLRGEYDYTVLEVALALKNKKSFEKIKGITYRQGEKIIRNENREYIMDLDKLPWPARHFLPIEKYFEPIFIGQPTLRIITSRGCPFQCKFCLWPQLMHGRMFRTRDPIKVVDEIEHLKEKYKIKEYYFDDDTFTVNPKRVEKICDEIIKRKINLPFDCLARVDTVNSNLLKKMKEAGCYVIRYGVESSSPEILKNIRKQITPEQIKIAFQETKKARIKTHATVMFGLPGETKETIKETIRFVLKLDPDYAQFPVAVPYPGTEFYNFVKEKGWLKSNDWGDFEGGKAVVEYPNLNRQEIEKASKTAYKKFYLRSKYIFKKIKETRSPKTAIQLFKNGLNLLKNL